MTIALVLLGKLLPLYAFIGLGFLAAKLLGARKETLSSILIYILAPIVVFDGVLRTEISWSILSLPLIMLMMCTVLCRLFFAISSFFWKDSHRNILAFTAGTGNTGYFGLPVALAVFGPDRLGPVVLALLGFILYENTVGFFTVARGHHTAAESFRKILRLPTLYALAIALILNLSDVGFGTLYLDNVQHVRGAYTVFGMMIIGMGIGSLEHIRLDGRFIGLAFLAKFVAWPTLALSLIAIDRTWLGFYTHELYGVMLLMSIVPLAANTVAYATELKTEPEKAATAVLLSTLFALFFIPFVASVSTLL